jgi:hypothetical protein
MSTDVFVNFSGGGKAAPSGKHQIDPNKEWSVGRDGRHTVMRFYRVNEDEETIVRMTDGLRYSIVNKPRRGKSRR